MAWLKAFASSKIDVQRRSGSAARQYAFDGKIDAVIGPNVLPSITARDSRTRRLFRDFRKEEQEYYRKTKIFPTSHIVTLKQAFVDKHPNAPVALLKAFRKSRDVAFDRLIGPDPQVIAYSWIAAAVAEQRELMGDDYWAYNVPNNVRESRSDDPVRPRTRPVADAHRLPDVFSSGSGGSGGGVNSRRYRAERCLCDMCRGDRRSPSFV